MPGEPQTELDAAWAAFVAGQREVAIRRCVALLEASPGQLGAALLLTELLAEARPDAVKATGERLVSAFIARGDLPRAVVAARTLPGAAATKAIRAIAVAFGKGSKRVADVAPAPPPLPAETADADGPDVSGEALLDRAAEALRTLDVGELDPAAKIPLLPLFGALSPPALEQLLSVWELRTLAEGEAAIHEGTEGRDAFVVVRGHLRAERGEGDDALTLAELGPGALFGEMALVSESPRAASVIAAEPVQLLAASREALEKLAAKTPVIGQQLSEFCRARMVSNLVRHSPILAAVGASERAALMRRFETRRFKPGEHLITFEQEPEGLFLVASGAVDVVGRDADGEALKVAELGPGDVVGEISLVLRRPATADVVATHQTVALELAAEQFREAIREHPSLLGELYELATKREDEMRTVVAQEALDVEEVVLL